MRINLFRLLQIRQPPPEPGPVPVRPLLKGAWGATIAALIAADVVMTAAGNDGKWHALVRQCLDSSPAPAAQGPAAPADHPGP